MISRLEIWLYAQLNVNFIYFGSRSRSLYAFGKKTGKSHWIVKQGYRVEESTLCIYHNKFTFFAADGYVHAIEQATINREEKENHIGN